MRIRLSSRARVILAIQLAVASLVVSAPRPGFVAGATPTKQPVAAVPVASSITVTPVVDDVIVASAWVRAAPPPAPPPPHSVLFAQLPVNAGAAVFIPIRPGLAGTRMAIPSTTPGYSPDITLTFDDCGDPANIGAIVDILQREQRHGIFFVTGQCRDRYPWLVEQLIAAGQQVCNHTYSHPDLRRLSDAAIRAEIAGGVMAGCPYFRPPYGSWDGPRGRIARIAGEYGLTVMTWDVDTRDWADADPAAMVAAIRARGGVVLFHLHAHNTVAALNALG